MSFSYINCENDNKPKTNADKYLKDGVDSYKLYEEFDNFCLREMVRHDKGSFKAFMGQPVKPTLTEYEEVILRNIDKNYTEICRNESGYLCLLEVRETGTKFDDTFACYNHLFQFIQPRRRI